MTETVALYECALMIALYNTVFAAYLRSVKGHLRALDRRAAACEEDRELLWRAVLGYDGLPKMQSDDDD